MRFRWCFIINMKFSPSSSQHPHSAVNIITPHQLFLKSQREDSDEDSVKSQSLPKHQPLRSKKTPKEPSLVCNTSDTRYPVVRKVIKKLGIKADKKQPEGNNWDLMWTDNAVQPEDFGKMNSHQKVNHFPGMFCLSRKNHLGRNLMKMRKKFPEEYNFFPLTWMLPSDITDLRAYVDKNKKNMTFIVKPEAGCQGKGIFLVKNIEDIPYGEHFVVQKYLTKPFLLDELKFDFRIYILLAGCSPLRIYLYNQGLARFATEKYTAPTKDNIDVSYMHLTNYAINKGNDKFVYNESDKDMSLGHKRSLTSVMALLDQMGHSSKDLWVKIKDMIVKTLISGQPILSHHYKSCQPENYPNNMCFQVLGLDVILDNHCNPYLLEVNYTPSFSTDTPLDSSIKFNLLKDSIQLMNITNKAKKKVQTENKEVLMKRMLSGKKLKVTPEEREALIEQAQKNRDKWEDKHLGGFQKIFPLNGADAKFDQFLKHSEECYLEQTGANIRRNSKKEKEIVIPPKKEAPNQLLSRVYNRPARPKTAAKKLDTSSKRDSSQVHSNTVEPIEKLANKTLDQKRMSFMRQFKTTLYNERPKASQASIYRAQPQSVTFRRNLGNYIQPRLFMLSPFGQ